MHRCWHSAEGCHWLLQWECICHHIRGAKGILPAHHWTTHITEHAHTSRTQHMHTHNTQYIKHTCVPHTTTHITWATRTASLYCLHTCSWMTWELWDKWTLKCRYRHSWLFKDDIHYPYFVILPNMQGGVKYLYVNTDTSIYRLPVQRCGRYLSCRWGVTSHTHRLSMWWGQGQGDGKQFSTSC